MTVSINQMLGGKKHGRRHKNGAVPLVGRMKSVTVNANSLFFLFRLISFFFLTIIGGRNISSFIHEWLKILH